MRKGSIINRSKFFLIIITCLFVLESRCFSEDGFLSSPLGKKLIDAGLYFVTNPGDFLFDLHHDAMDYTPLPQNKSLGVHTNLLLLANPGLVNSISVKLAFKEGVSLPQFGVFGGYWKTLLLDILSGPMKLLNSDLYGWSAGFFIAKKVDPQTRLFTHISYSRVRLNVTLEKPIVIVKDVLAFDSLIANNVFDTYIFTGIERTTGEYKDIIVIAQTGYGVRNNKIVGKILIHAGAMEFGLTIYPEGLLVVHPVINMQFRF